MTMALLIMSACVTASAAGECEHDYQPVTMLADCEVSGYIAMTCSKCGQVTNSSVLWKLEHEYGDWETVRESTCTQLGLEQRVCGLCQSVEERETEKLAHTYVSEIKEPTCGRDGYTLQTCGVCGHEEKTDIVTKLGHNYEVTVVPPTCTADGYTRHKCGNCGDAYRTDPQKKTGHCYDEGVQTKEGSLTAMGRITYTCQSCGDTYQDTTPKWVDPFEDVEKSQFFYDSVLWAYNTGIAMGVDETHFDPFGVCTRGQVVTFLWREAGAPEPAGGASAFKDVCSGNYCYAAVQWAVEQEITNGVDDTHFAPDQPCTRCQVVTFLHRAKGLPEGKYTSEFSDVKEGDYFFDAVNWAYQKGITTGTGTGLFSPHEDCTRGQIVTFLRRAREQ